MMLTPPGPQGAAPHVAGDAELELLLGLGLPAPEADLEAVQGDGVAHAEAGEGCRRAVEEAVCEQHEVAAVDALPGDLQELPLPQQLPPRHDHLNK